MKVAASIVSFLALAVSSVEGDFLPEGYSPAIFKTFCVMRTLTFGDSPSGSLVDEDAFNDPEFMVKITGEPRNKRKCGGLQFIDTSNPLDGCAPPSDGDDDLEVPGGHNAIIFQNITDTSGCVANDCSFGGTIDFTFSRGVWLKSVTLLDIEGVPHNIKRQTNVTIWKPNGSEISIATDVDGGDGNLVTVGVYKPTKKLQVVLGGSGAVYEVAYKKCFKKHVCYDTCYDK